MIDGVFVVDAAVHGFNFTSDNLRAPFMPEIVRMLYHFGFDTLHPLGDARYRLTFEQFQNLFTLQPELMQRVLFAESHIDMACYHGVPMYGLFGDGSSPIWIGEQIAAQFPHRMHIYADLSPTHPDPVGWIDSVAGRPNVLGVKFYPVDLVEGKIVTVQLDDDKAVMPLIERCRTKGIGTIAVHKAVPLGPIGREHYHVRDMAPAIAAFPDLQFEIVHGGFAFAEETAALLDKYDNVWINLESTPCYAVNNADKFADIIEPLIATGKHERIMFATGATGMHPQPFVEAFWRLEMPRGYSKLSDEMKAGILGRNFCTLHGIDVEAARTSCSADIYGIDGKLDAPWTMVRELEQAAA